MANHKSNNQLTTNLHHGNMEIYWLKRSQMKSSGKSLNKRKGKHNSYTGNGTGSGTLNHDQTGLEPAGLLRQNSRRKEHPGRKQTRLFNTELAGRKLSKQVLVADFLSLLRPTLSFDELFGIKDHFILCLFSTIQFQLYSAWLIGYRHDGQPLLRLWLVVTDNAREKRDGQESHRDKTHLASVPHPTLSERSHQPTSTNVCALLTDLGTKNGCIATAGKCVGRLLYWR